jgi:hypothetical protein
VEFLQRTSGELEKSREFAVSLAAKPSGIFRHTESAASSGLFIASQIASKRRFTRELENLYAQFIGKLPDDEFLVVAGAFRATWKSTSGAVAAS